MIDPLSLVRGVNSLLGSMVPGASAVIAERLFTSPRRHPVPDREFPAERAGQRLTLGDGLSALRWGRGPRILVMHGWEGRATQWGPFAELAIAGGFEVIAVDAPGHGRSDGHRSHPGEFVRALLEADRRHGPFTAVIGHSMGGAAAAIAVASGLRADRLVLIASPSSLARVLRRFAAHIRLSAAAERGFFDRMELRVGRPAEDLDVSALVLGCAALVIHSRDDREVPFADGEAIRLGWPHAELLAVDGLGHRRILRDSGVLEAALGFCVDAEQLAKAG
ncbi:MAG TPA: alpha/beta fold hydrolase [Enhygromyxa sp.]|nr:alpha/beta fold hydrolase [Enhygromyxa sp.]